MIYNYISQETQNPVDLRREVISRLLSRQTPSMSSRNAYGALDKNHSYQLIKQLQLQNYINNKTVEVFLSENSGLPYDNRYVAYEYIMYKNQNVLFELDISSEILKLIHQVYGFHYNISTINMMYGIEELEEFANLSSCFLYKMISPIELKRFIELLKRNKSLWKEMGRGLRLDSQGEVFEEELLSSLRARIKPTLTSLMNMMYDPIYRQELIDGFKLSLVSCDEHRVLVTTGADEVRLKLILDGTMYTVEGKVIKA